MAPTPCPDVSDAWRVVQYTDRHGDVAHEKVTLEHDESGVSIFARELPNGARVDLRRPANLPGGFDIVHEVAPGDFEAAVQEAERFAAMFEREGAWLVEGAPVLH